MRNDPLSTKHMALEPRRCPTCGSPTFVMLHHWQAGDPALVRRTVWCRRSVGPIWECRLARGDREPVRAAAARLGIPVTEHDLPPDVVHPAPFAADNAVLSATPEETQ
jgi:hypothetical protein